MAFLLYNLLFTEWKVLEITDYESDRHPSAWHIYGRFLGVFWIEMFKNMSFVSPHSFSQVNFGYDSASAALKKISEKAGNGSVLKSNLIVKQDIFNPKYNKTDVLRYNVVKSRKFSMKEKFSVAGGFYDSNTHDETFVILDYAVDGCNSPSEAIMKASLKGITVDNPNRFRKYQCK